MTEGDAAGIAALADHFLHLLDGTGLSGTWTWVFATGDQDWSPGLFHLLGLEPGSVRPGYDRLLERVHPDDRAAMADAAEIRLGEVRDACAFRVIRPAGQIRLLRTSTDLHVGSDGRPRAAVGTVLDVTDREMPGRLRAEQERRWMALAHESLVVNYVFPANDPGALYPVYDGIFEPPLEEIFADPSTLVVPEARAEARHLLSRARQEGVLAQGTLPYRMAGGLIVPISVLEVPVRDAAGRIVEWAGLLRPAEAPAGLAPDALRAGLEQTVRGHHLRAARALLDWSMTDLVAASGLSLSTVRRLEEDAECAGARSRGRAIETLRRAGTRFILLDGGDVAVARR